MVPAVTCSVGLDLLAPEILPGRWPAKEMTIMPVPEAPMNEENGMMAGENQIGTAGQVLPVQSEPKSFPMKG